MRMRIMRRSRLGRGRLELWSEYSTEIIYRDEELNRKFIAGRYAEGFRLLACESAVAYIPILWTDTGIDVGHDNVSCIDDDDGEDDMIRYNEK